MKNIRPFLKTASYGMLLLFANQILFPMYSYAITGHSTMPEYGSFEPVSTSNMVNEFNGSFTYNLPLLNVPNGYPINLSYHSNSVNNESLASWVGLGWNINPGVINRNKKGFPDEYEGEKITYHNRMPANWTIAAKAGVNLDIFSKELGKDNTSKGALSANISHTLSYNNYNGLGTSTNFGLSDFAGVANINANFSNGKYNGATYSVNPMNILNALNGEAKGIERDEKGEIKDTKENEANLAYNADLKSRKKGSAVALSFFSPSFGPSFRAIPVSVTESFGFMTSIKVDFGVSGLPLSIKGQGSVTGTFTRQKNKFQVKSVPVYGYLNTEGAYADEESMMDFSMEMESHFEKNDEILGYPMANADNYSLSGEAFGGSFEAKRGDFGYFRPNRVKSEDIGIDVGISGTIPLNFIPAILNLEQGIGGSVAANYHSTVIDEWEDFVSPTLSSSIYDFKGDEDFTVSQEKSYYVFDGDMAGYHDFTVQKGDDFNDDPFSPGLSGVNATENFAGYRTFDSRSDGKLKKRSTQITTHTNADFLKEGNLDVPYKTLEKDLQIFVGGTSVSYVHGDYPDNAIAEIIATNKDGLTYVYGLPVYERNEKSIQYSFENGEGLNFSDNSNLAFSEDGMVAMVESSSIDSDAKVKRGQADANQYPTTYLLTQILTPDFVDRTGDGPSEDDFGGYTHFKYERVHGGSNSWYGHRNPYKGVSFSSGSLSSKRDDMGSFSYGEKEVYVLEEVHSKTHMAKFNKSDREDGRSVGFSNGASDQEVLDWSSESSYKILKRLDRVELFAKNYLGEASTRPLTSVNFDFDYSLAANLPNSSGSNGKLTLKKVWIEHGGISKNRIQPYEFSYEYPNISDYPVNGTHSFEQGKTINEYSNTLIPLSIQNPDYKVSNTDGWGMYQNYDQDKSSLLVGTENLKRFFPYNNQDPSYNLFDPAAYMLKQINLPSGGAIHVQYEQHDYSYVQNKKVMAMVPLHPVTDDEEEDSKIYYLDLSKIGVSLPSLEADQKELLKKIFEPMINGDRMYFNFLYSLVGGSPDYRYGTAEYIEGFSLISSFGVANKNGTPYAFLCFDNTNSASLWEEEVINPGKTSKREIPRKVCKDFYKSQRRLLVDGGQNAAGLSSSADAGDEKGMGKAFVSIIGNALKGVAEKCKHMDPNMSFVRLNLPLGDAGKVGKKGGGVRVKRMLMYEDGNMFGDGSSVFGKEYLYVTKDGSGEYISSGVATNESGSIKMENPWVLPIDKSTISKGEAILGASYLYKHMGPIGFGFMPGPSIGYSKVTSRSIHGGQTNLGSTVKEYHTSYDYPCFIQNQHDDAPIPKYGRTPQLASNIGIPGFSVHTEEFSATQGIVVHLNDMNGKPKSEKVLANDGSSVVSSTSYYYQSYIKKGDENKSVNSVTVMGDNMSVDQVALGSLGRNVDMYGYTKTIKDENVSMRATKDADGPGGVAFPGIAIPIPGFLAKIAKLKSPISASYSNVKYNTASVSKVVKHTSIATKTISTNDGITTVTTNEVFDNHTGDVVVTSYKDDFKQGTYIEQNFRASWNYPGMKSKYQNEGLIITTSDLGSSGSIELETTSGVTVLSFTNDEDAVNCDAIDAFTVGDFIEVRGSFSDPCLYHVVEIDKASASLEVEESMHSEENGDGYTLTEVEILKSGFTNQLNTNAGQTVFFYDGEVSDLFGENVDSENDFTQALNTIVTSGTHTLSGPYNNVDLSKKWGFCEGAQISNVEIAVIYQTEPVPTISYSIVSFNYVCPDGSSGSKDCSESSLIKN